MPGIKIILQNVNSASLLVDNKDKWVNIGKGWNKCEKCFLKTFFFFLGIVMFLAFTKGATEQDLPKVRSKNTFVDLKFFRFVRW